MRHQPFEYGKAATDLASVEVTIDDLIRSPPAIDLLVPPGLSHRAAVWEGTRFQKGSLLAVGFDRGFRMGQALWELPCGARTTCETIQP